MFLVLLSISKFLPYQVSGVPKKILTLRDNITNLAIYCLSLQSGHHGPPNCYAYKVTGECELNAWTIVGQETRQDSQTASLWVTALHRCLAIVLGL